MSRILISGSLGFIGSHLTESFINRDDTVIGIDDLSGGDFRNMPTSSKRRDLLKLFVLDITDYLAMEEIFAAERPDIIYHCAANAREGASFYDPYNIVRRNVLISSVLLELAVRYKATKFVFLSSMSVYGRQKCPFDETMKKRPVDPYGAAKAATEDIVEQVCEAHGMKWTILRPHNCFGSNQSLSDPYRNAVAIFMNRCMRGEPIYLYGKGHIRAFSYIDDALPAFIRAADPLIANGEIINVGGKKPIKVREMAEAVIREMGTKTEIIELDSRYGEVEVAYSTHEKSEKLLGYKENAGWQAGIKTMKEWAKTIGPQVWKKDKLAIPNPSMPSTWKELNG